mgnify:CR=1 FL=1
MCETITIPHIDKTVEWQNGDCTVIVGSHGTGKTLLIEAMKSWCDEKEYEYIHYDAHSAFDDVYELIKNSDDIDIIHSCMIMSTFIKDFEDDIRVWALAKGYKETEEDKYIRDPTLLRAVLRGCGTGYTRMFIFTIKAIQNPSANYYFLDLPETSLHVMVARKIITYIMSNFRHLKIVAATHSPEIMDDVYNINEEYCTAEEEDSHMIDLGYY